MTDPAQALAEMARVLRPGGRAAIVDIVVPNGCEASIQKCDRARSRSLPHEYAHRRPIPRLFRGCRLRVRSEDLRDGWQDFDAWMNNAGSVPAMRPTCKSEP